VKSKFYKEYLGRSIATVFGFSIIILTISITLFLFSKGIQTFTVYKHSIWEFLFSSKWNPAELEGTGQIGSAIFIVGSLTISLLGVLIATPFSMAAAIFISEISPKLGKVLLQPAIEIFVGIPSVVYGWVGLTVLLPFIAHVFHLPFGFSVLGGGIVLAVMIFPTITSVAADAIRNVPSEYRDASYALGSTRWQMIWNIKHRSALPGILTGIVLGLARAFGEALAVAMLIGRKDAFIKNILSPTNNLTAKITSDMGNTTTGTEWNDSLWSMALLLFVISFLFIVIIRVIGKKGGATK
jgi:phosphate transport system permease protein